MSTSWSAATSTSTTWRRSSGRAATGRRACATAPGSSSGLRRFLEDGGFTAFTDTFEDLHGLKQLPGLAVQRLMADGYGFGGEGDWKTAAMVRAMKVMSAGLDGRRLVHGGLHLPPDRAATTSSSAPTCSRCARRSPAAGRASRSTRCPSAARRTRSGSCSTPTRAPPSPPASPTWGSASAWSRPSSTSCRRSSPCRSSRSPAPCGVRDPTFGPTRRPGSTPAARITPASATA